jgi:hypothetical protein
MIAVTASTAIMTLFPFMIPPITADHLVTGRSFTLKNRVFRASAKDFCNCQPHAVTFLTIFSLFTLV